MARIEHTKSARKRKDGKPPFTCTSCHKPIEVGQGFSTCSPSRYSPTFRWHDGCPSPRPSQLESNEKRARAMEAFEDAYADLEGFEHEPDENADEVDYEALSRDAVDRLREIGETCAEGVREAAEMWRESQSNIEDGFGHSTMQSDEMGEHADNYDSIADECEQIADTLDDFDQFDSFDEWLTAAVESASEALSSAEAGID